MMEDGPALLLKKERVEDLPEDTQETWMTHLEPAAKVYDRLCQLSDAREAGGKTVGERRSW